MSGSHLIGITGGIGSGKSCVSRFWAAYARLPRIDIDQVCRELLEVEMPGWLALKACVDESFFRPDGRLRRSVLRSAIFADDGMRLQVDKLIHPLALDLLRRRTKDIEGPVLVDVPLLFEAGWEDAFLRTVVVYADRLTCCRRVCGRDNVPPDEAAKAVSAQMAIGEKAMRADHVIDNRNCWLLTRMQTAHLAGWLECHFA
ncbi:MAG: dephospho-CoA kinase [Desulfobulbaceae bacterium]|nr:dephospho-CoA kinase [Desulfobulbaceae bacterium]